MAAGAALPAYAGRQGSRPALNSANPVGPGPVRGLAPVVLTVHALDRGGHSPVHAGGGQTEVWHRGGMIPSRDHSSTGSRAISSASASSGVTPPNATSHTASVIGSS